MLFGFPSLTSPAKELKARNEGAPRNTGCCDDVSWGPSIEFNIILKRFVVYGVSHGMNILACASVCHNFVVDTEWFIHAEGSNEIVHYRSLYCHFREATLRPRPVDRMCLIQSLLPKIRLAFLLEPSYWTK